ncbi:unnamed protein product [Sphagnum balticum]
MQLQIHAESFAQRLKPRLPNLHRKQIIGKEEEEEEETALCKPTQRSMAISSYKETKEERQLQRVYKKDDQGEERGE